MARIDYITVGSTTYDIGSTGGHTIQDSNDDTFIGRGYLKFDGLMTVEDNETDDQTIVDIPAMSSADMAEVLETLPSVSFKYPKYSTDEQVVAEWIDGKPIYQKVITNLSITMNWYQQYQTQGTPTKPDNMDNVISVEGITSNGSYSNLAFDASSNLILSNNSMTINTLIWTYTKTTDTPT